jgi:hypothetical protein
MSFNVVVGKTMVKRRNVSEWPDFREKYEKIRTILEKGKVTLEYHENIKRTIAETGKTTCKRYLYCILVNKGNFSSEYLT